MHDRFSRYSALAAAAVIIAGVAHGSIRPDSLTVISASPGTAFSCTTTPNANASQLFARARAFPSYSSFLPV